jgi:cobalt-zinc-cadmium efflux system membrane fusion protein
MPAVPKRLFACAAFAFGGLGAALLSIHLSASPAGSLAAASLHATDARVATLDLQPAQVDELRIEAVQTHAFPIEKHAVGSISFDEDPAIVQAESALLAAAANLELSNKELRRVESLGEGNGIAQKELEQALSAQETAEAALKAARDAVRALGKTDAEIDRMIAARRIQIAVGEHARRKWALANVAESDSVSVRPAQPVALTVMAFPGRTFSGKVSRIYAAVDPVTHRVAVRAEIADPHDELRAGMLAEFTIRVAPALQSVAIPANGAVRETDGSTSVWVTTDRRHFAQRKVSTGERDGGWVQILEGVHPGELIVSDGAVFLSNLLEAPPSD